MGAKIDPWMREAPVQAPTVLQRGISLSKLADGTARLLWVFDEDGPKQEVLAVHLTDREAQIVFETPAPVGLLERVRTTLRHSDAVLWRSGQCSSSAKFIAIPREGDEDFFWDFMEGLAEEAFPIGPLPALSFHESIAAVTGDYR
ncbi:hypothetical protein [Mycobacteroides chelonae]|nr:hypothetical protein [Mycobacteroides chelonae]